MCITIVKVIENEWFKKGYKPPIFANEDVSLDDVDAIFNESRDTQNLVVERREEQPVNPVSMNTFEYLYLNLRVSTSVLCLKSKWYSLELKLQAKKTGRKGHLFVATEIYEVSPSLCMVELRKVGGDTLEFHKFYKNLVTGLKDIVWKSEDETKEEANDGVLSHAKAAKLYYEHSKTRWIHRALACAYFKSIVACAFIYEPLIDNEFDKEAASRALAFDLVATSLNSNECFLLQSGSSLFTWHGNQSTFEQQQLAAKVAEFLKRWSSAGFHELGKGGFRGILMNAVVAAAKRSQIFSRRWFMILLPLLIVLVNNIK
ncbi:unnamed protein product [Camellia sinensis]